MGISRLGALCIAAALAFAAPSEATPITVIVDTSAYSGPPADTLDLVFDLFSSTTNSVSVTNFTSDGQLDSSTIVTMPASPTTLVTGSLDTNDLVLQGDGGTTFPVEYLESIAAGAKLSFTFETTNLDAQDGFGPDGFGLLVQAGGVPIVTTGPGNYLFLYSFGTPDASGLQLFSSDTLSVREAVPSIPEPGVLALVAAALFGMMFARFPPRVRLRDWIR